jgi:hypothetical protein
MPYQPTPVLELQAVVASRKWRSQIVSRTARSTERYIAPAQVSGRVLELAMASRDTHYLTQAKRAHRQVHRQARCQRLRLPFADQTQAVRR